MTNKFVLFDHTADLGVRATAPDLGELVTQAVQGFYATIGTVAAGSATVADDLWIIDADSRADALRDLLARLLDEFELRQRVAADVALIRFEESGLEARVSLAPLDLGRSELQREVKAVTYHELTVEKVVEGWTATFIVDI